MLSLGLVLLLSLQAALFYKGRSLSGVPRAEPVRHAEEARKAEIDARFKQGVVMLHAKRYEHAAVAFHRVLELAPEMPEAHVNMGFTLLGQKENAMAESFFKGAIALRPGQANAYYGLALALEAQGDLPGALGAMRAYLHLTPPDDRYVGKARATLLRWEADMEKITTARKPEGRRPASQN